MKKIVSVFVLLLSLVMVLSGCGSALIEDLNADNILSSNNVENDLSGVDYELMLENDKLEFYVNPDTTEIKVVNKADSSVWTSTNSTRTVDEAKALLQLEYTTTGGVTNKINSYEGAVVNGQYQIEKADNKVTISYSIGDFTSQILVPEVISKERYNELYAKFGDDFFAATKFKNQYRVFDRKKMDEDNVFAMDTLKKYPILENEVMYVVSESVMTNTTVKKEFAELLKTINYTKEDYEKDSANFENVSNELQEPGFNISLEFSLDGGDLIVNIPNDKIEMYMDFPLTNITLLKYFGSQSEGSTGYLLLPDGSGSIMNCFNGKTNGHEYSTRVYGAAYSLSESEKTNNYNNATLPIFGINAGQNGIFAEITKGDTIAEVTAYSGDSSEVAYAAPRFRFRETFISRLSGTKDAFSTIQKQRFPGDMQVRYSFLVGEESTYNGMAALYRNRLFDGTNVKADKISVVVEYIGMIQKQAQMFGIAYDKDIVMTTYDQVGKYATEWQDAGVKNLNIKMSGWFGDGYNHGSLSNVTPLKSLGGTKGLKALTETLSEKGISFWPDADIQYTVASGIGSKRKAIRTIDKKIGQTYEYNLASFNKVYNSDSKRVNTLTVVLDELSSLKKGLKKNDLSTVSFRSLGQGLNPDFNEDNFYDIQTVTEKTVEALKKLKEEGTSFITSGANAYVLKLADMCLDIPLVSNEYDSTDYSIPFLQMVIRGSVNYSGKAVNLTGDTKNAVLLAAQTGANLYYVFAGDNSEEVVNSDFADFFSIDYDYYKDSVIDIVKEYQNSFESTAGQKIKSFENLASGVTKTVFENGVISYVNTNNYEAVADDLTLEAKSYVVKKG